MSVIIKIRGKARRKGMSKLTPRVAHTPLHISGVTGETVSNFLTGIFLGVHITDNFTWSLKTSSLVKKAQQCLYFLRSLKRASRCTPILTYFYRCFTESILTCRIIGCYRNLSFSDRKELQQVVKTGQSITGSHIPAISKLSGVLKKTPSGKIPLTPPIDFTFLPLFTRSCPWKICAEFSFMNSYFPQDS